MVSDADPAFSMFQSIYKLYKANNNCDFQLISADNQKLNTHSFILYAAVPKLRKVISENFKKNLKKLRLKEVNGRELELLLQFAYLKKCDDLQQDDKAALVELIKAAKYLQMTELEAELLETLKRNIDMTAALKVLANRDNVHLTSALPMAENFLFRHLLDENAANLGFDEFKAILCDDRLHASHEEKVWEAIVKWISEDTTKRIPLLVSLLDAVRVGFIAPEYMDLISNHPLVSSNPKALLHLHKANKVTQVYQEPSDLLLAQRLPSDVRPRLPHISILAIGGWRIKEHLCSMAEVYDVLADKWTPVPKLRPSEVRGYHGLEKIENSLYLVGGGTNEKSLNVCCKLDLGTQEWSPVCSMSHARCFVSTAVLDGELYAIGGRELEQRLNSAEKYSPKSDTWARIANTHYHHSDADAAALDGKVYVVGGFNGNEVLNSLECYSPDTNTWMTLTPMNKPRSGLACVAHRGQLFVFGGFDGTERLCDGERYNPKTHTWTSLAPMRQARSTFSLVRAEDVLYAIGGYSDKPEASVEAYDVIGDKWYTLRDMLEPTSAVACVAVDDLAFSQSMWSEASRSDPSCALRDLMREYPPYHPPTSELMLPEGVVEIHRPQLPEALPMPWADLFQVDNQFDLSEDELDILDEIEFEDGGEHFYESDISTDRED